MIYIQRKDAYQLETIDQFETRREAMAMLEEYQAADFSASYYLSSRACNEWREAS